MCAQIRLLLSNMGVCCLSKKLLMTKVDNFDVTDALGDKANCKTLRHTV